MYTIDYNVALSKNMLIPVVLLFSLLIIGSVNADESDIEISSIRYTNDFENGESITIIDSGRDGSATNTDMQYLTMMMIFQMIGKKLHLMTVSGIWEKHHLVTNQMRVLNLEQYGNLNTQAGVTETTTT